MRKLASTILGAALATAFCMDAAAQAWPNRPIRLINASAIGGPQELIARVIAEGISPALGQPVVVESRPGGAGGGQLGMNAVAAAAPDGYFLGLGSSGILGVTPAVQKLEWDSVKSFTMITQIGEGPLLLYSSAALPITNVQELVAYAKANPGKLNYSSSGVGSLTHLSMELFKVRAGGLDLHHVPYNGTDAMRQSLLAGDTHIMIVPPAGPVNAVVKEGKVRALAVLQPKRSPQTPDVPTIWEAGVPNVEVTGWQALVGPAGLPREIQMRLNREVTIALAKPDAQARILTTAQIVKTTTPEELGAYIAGVNRQWREVVEKANIKVAN